MSGRRPIPRRRPFRLLPVAWRDPARASAAPAVPRPRRELPGHVTAPEGRAAAPGFRPGAGQPPGRAASAGPTGSAPEHKRSPTGTPHGPAGPAAHSQDRIPGRSSRGQRRDQAGHRPRARTDPLARTGPPDRSLPPTRTGPAHRKGRCARRPEARSGRRAPARHPAYRARAGSTGPCPALLSRRTEPAAFADSASLRHPTSRAKTTTPIPVGRAGPGDPVSLRHPACRRHQARSTDRAGPAQTAERPGAAGLARSAGLAGSTGRADPMAPDSAGGADSTGRAGSLHRRARAGLEDWEPAHPHFADLPERIRPPRLRRAG